MSANKLVIPPPRSDRPPMLANAFDVAQGSNTQLKPMFPYLHPGAMVPCSALLIGGPNADYGHFFHHNTQHEIVLTLAANGAMLPTGQLYVGAVIHGVNSFLKNEKDPKSFATFVITQVQSESGVQTEGCSLRCEKCHEQIFFKEFDATPAPDATEATHPLPSVAALPDLFGEYNNDKARHVCAKCGHVSRDFPVAAWGWDTYAEQSAAAIAARQALTDAARAAA